MIRISKKRIISFQKALIEHFGGSHGMRDENALDSALNVAFQTFDGKDLYETDVEKIAAICFSIICNHPFIDGNKRIGMHTLLTLLCINFYEVRITQDEVKEMGIGIASGKYKQKDIQKWINKHLV